MQFGTLTIDKNALLTENRLIAKNSSGGTVMNRRIDNDFIRLIMMDNKRGKIDSLSETSKEIYRRLYALSNKSNLTQFEKRILLIDDPADALNRLELLVGMQLAGNNNKNIKNDIILISDYLHKKGLIDLDELKILHA